KPTAPPEKRSLAWLALAQRARIRLANEDPLLEHARLAADRTFDLLGRAIYDGNVLAAVVEWESIADWVELGGGRVIRADTVHFAADLDEPQLGNLARARESHLQLDHWLEERGAAELPLLPRAFYGPFRIPIPTKSGCVWTTILYERDFGPYGEGEIEALFD